MQVLHSGSLLRGWKMPLAVEYQSDDIDGRVVYTAFDLTALDEEVIPAFLGFVVYGLTAS